MPAPSPSPRSHLHFKTHRNAPLPSGVAADADAELITRGTVRAYVDALSDAVAEQTGDMQRELVVLRAELSDAREQIATLRADLQIARATNITALDRGRNVA